MITNGKVITKYFIEAEGNIPIAVLDLTGNPFTAEQRNIIARSYIEKTNDNNYRLEIIMGEIELKDSSAFEFLVKNFKKKKSTALIIPLTITLKKEEKSIETYDSEFIEETLK